MPATLESLSQDALILPPDQRLVLARRLLDSVDLEPELGAAAAWEAEIVNRIGRFDRGESRSVSAGEVFARLRQIAPDR
jgi:putative addiction module component (TIGR02574 family)